jgi:cytokinesis protein
MSSSEAHHSLFYHSRSNHSSDTFHFPRPETDEEIEKLFENVKRTRTQGELPNLPIEQKWHMVYNDEHLRWKEERAREEQSRRQKETGQLAQIMTESPEWYIQKFLDKTITPKQCGGLHVSLRSKEMRYDWR